jgi:NAD(P)H-dependent FMN reductase
MMKLLAISGSLRSASSNTALLRAMSNLAPDGVEFSLYERLADIPPFNPDFDGEGVAEPVRDFRSRLQDADGVLISSPEYAHGVPGVLKNALDWDVSSGGLYRKPVALVYASPRGTYAQAALVEILNTMNAQIIPEASVTVELMGKKPGEIEALLAMPEVSTRLRLSIEKFVKAIATT